MKKIQQVQQKNPCDRNGIHLRCHMCKRIHHKTQNSPEKYDNDTLYT